MPTLPFKLNQDRRHHIPKQKHKVTNWREYARIPQMDWRSVGVVRRFWRQFQSLTVNQRAEHVGRDG